MKSDKNYYETDNLSLAPYLAMYDLKYVGIKKEPRSNKYLFVFEDGKMQGNDLAMSFLKSNERRYKNFWSFFRNELSKAMNSKEEELLMKSGKE